MCLLHRESELNRNFARRRKGQQGSHQCEIADLVHGKEKWAKDHSRGGGDDERINTGVVWTISESYE